MSAGHKSFYRLVSLLLLTRGADALTTYIGSPDLRYELNPIVSIFHQGWIGLFLMAATITSALIYLAYLHYVRPLSYRLLPTRGYRSVRNFAVCACFGPEGKMTDFLYRMPNTKLLARWAGFVGGYGLVFYGFFVVANNLILIYPSFLTRPWIAAGLASSAVDIPFILITASVLTVQFFKTQYQRAVGNSRQQFVAHPSTN